MAKFSEKTERTALEKVRRHIRILIEVGRIARDSELGGLLCQAVLQVARAVEIDHVKILQYRRRTADLLVVAGLGWADGVVGSAVLSADMRSANRKAHILFADTGFYGDGFAGLKRAPRRRPAADQVGDFFPLGEVRRLAFFPAGGGGAKTSRIEIDTAVIDMRYENPLLNRREHQRRFISPSPGRP